MSALNGRRAPNVSQYLRDLNTISPQDTTGDERMEEDQLALFTNTEFYDYDLGQNTDYQTQPVKVDTAAPTPAASTADDPTSASSIIGDVSSIDFMSGDYHFSDFSPAYQAPSINSFPDGAHNFQPLQPSHGSVYPNTAAHAQLAQFAQPPSRTADKRKSDSNQALSLEERSRVAAEEDKRRRNTAASARFRVKKKQREQALEKSAKEMTDKVTSLESKVSQLETENKWLKNLLVDKNGGSEDIISLWKEFTKHASQQRTKTDTAAKADR